MPRTRMRRCLLAGYGCGCPVVLATAASLVIGSLTSTNSLSLPETATADPSDHKFDPSRVMGAKACIRCHRSEYAHWLKTTHHRSQLQLKTAAALKHATAMGIAKADILKESICVSCHTTPRTSESGKTAAYSGVSCESCHGPSGGDPGWLNRHAVYGPEGTRRDQETGAHREARLAYCRKHGKVGPESLYSLAKKCLQCHLIGNEKLVKAGHKLGRNNFEFASWASGEVRHNFHLDQTKNADASTLWMNPIGSAKRLSAARRRRMFIVGIFADLELSLRIRAKATDAAFAGQLGGRIGTYAGKFGQINVVAGTPETKKVAALLTPLLGRLFAIQPGDGKFFNAQADKIAQAAKDFLANDSLAKIEASKSKGLDSMIPKPYFSVSPGKKK